MNEPNGRWFDCLPSCEARVPCGHGMHPVRWQAGSLLLPEHPDTEAELVLAALGGEKAGCVAVAEAWGRHAGDLSVLAVGPRGPRDEVRVGWDDVDAAAQSRRAGYGSGWVGYAPGGGPARRYPMPPGARHGPIRLAVPAPISALSPAAAARRRPPGGGRCSRSWSGRSSAGTTCCRCSRSATGSRSGWQATSPRPTRAPWTARTRCGPHPCGPR